MKKSFAFVTTFLSVGLCALPAFASDAGDMSFTVANLQTIISTLTGIINVGTIIPMLAAILGVGIVFVFMWWGVRKGLSSVFGSIKKGRVKV